MRKSLVSSTGILFAWLVATTLCSAGQGSIDGTEKSLWTEERHSVIVAKVIQSDKVEKSLDKGRALLVPLVTLAGQFDPSEYPELPAEFWYGGLGTKIRQLPPVGRTILAVIATAPRESSNRVELPVLIVPEICSFMPGNSGIEVIDDLNDPRVLEVLKNIRLARYKGEAKRREEEADRALRADIERLLPPRRPTTRPAH